VKLLVIGTAIIIAAGLSGCDQPHLQSSAHGRYVGIGIYSPRDQWTRMAGADAPKVTPSARTIDDQVIIVVEDTQTGEIRACGDLTGYCIGSNPWKKMLASSQMIPISMTEHVKPPSDTPPKPAK